MHREAEQIRWKLFDRSISGIRSVNSSRRFGVRYLKASHVNASILCPIDKTNL
jgi:hypothetical protein